MYVTIYVGESSDNYTQIRNLSFAPSIDVISERLAIDEFECDYVGDRINVGNVAQLRDDNNTLWFDGFVVYSENNHIRVQNGLTYLDRKVMPAKMYSNMSVDSAIAEVLNGTKTQLTIDTTATSGKTITGFCKEMTARERLQQILFVSGLYVQSTFVTPPVVTALDVVTIDEIPVEVTYWKPTTIYNEYVTDVEVTAYSFTQGTPAQGDEYVTDGTNTWIVTKSVFTQHNTDLPSGDIVATNVVRVEDVMLITDANSSVIAGTLAAYHFKRVEIDFEAINDAEYKCGDQVRVNLDSEGSKVDGFITSTAFSFGVQSKARMRLGACEEINPADWVKVTIEYISKSSPLSNVVLGTKVYTVRPNSRYEVTNPYFTLSRNGVQYVFRPASATTTGNTGSSDISTTVNCYIALEKNTSTGVLTIISVDHVERTESTVDEQTIYIAEID